MLISSSLALLNRNQSALVDQCSQLVVGSTSLSDESDDYDTSRINLNDLLKMDTKGNEVDRRLLKILNFRMPDKLDENRLGEV